MNRILEIVNNLRTINQIAVAIYLTGFLVWVRNAPAQTVMMADARRLGLCLGVGLLLHYYGGSIVGITIWIQRAMGLGGGPGTAAWSSVPGMVAGSILMAISAVLVLRIMSINKFGNTLWQAMVVVDVIYLAVAIMSL